MTTRPPGTSTSGTSAARSVVSMSTAYGTPSARDAARRARRAVVVTAARLVAEVKNFARSNPSDKLELKPGGYHMMLMDLKRPLKEGDTLDFWRVEAIEPDHIDEVPRPVVTLGFRHAALGERHRLVLFVDDIVARRLESLALLGEVDELEVERERAGHGRGLVVDERTGLVRRAARAAVRRLPQQAGAHLAARRQQPSAAMAGDHRRQGASRGRADGGAAQPASSASVASSGA